MIRPSPPVFFEIAMVAAQQSVLRHENAAVRGEVIQLHVASEDILGTGQAIGLGAILSHWRRTTMENFILLNHLQNMILDDV